MGMPRTCACAREVRNRWGVPSLRRRVPVISVGVVGVVVVRVSWMLGAGSGALLGECGDEVVECVVVAGDDGGLWAVDCGYCYSVGEGCFEVFCGCGY